MFALIRFEIRKILCQKKSWMGILTVLLINALLALGFYLNDYKRGATPSPADMTRTVSEFMNAYTYTQTILAPAALILFPMVLSIYASYMLAGEFEVGSIRMLLFRPVSRLQILIAKFVALTLYAAMLLLTLAVVSLAVSSVLFEPRGPVQVFGPLFNLPAQARFLIHPAEEGLLRIALSYALALPMLMSVCAMALMLALATRHFTSSSILTSTLYFCSHIVSTIPFLAALHPYLPSRYWPFFRYALMGTKDSIPWDTIVRHGGWTAAYTLVFLAIAAALFNMRDV